MSDCIIAMLIVARASLHAQRFCEVSSGSKLSLRRMHGLAAPLNCSVIACCMNRYTAPAAGTMSRAARSRRSLFARIQMSPSSSVSVATEVALRAEQVCGRYLCRATVFRSAAPNMWSAYSHSSTVRERQRVNRDVGAEAAAGSMASRGER